MAGLTHPVSQYQLFYVSDGEKPGRAALDSDVQPGSTPQFGGKPLPLMLTPEATKHGTFYLMRESLRNYQNKVLHAWIARWIYQDVPIYRLFKMQLMFGLVAFALQLPFSIPKDIRRIKNLRYGRRLKGPVLVNGNSIMTTAYWEIVRRIVTLEQRGEYRAEYGEQLIDRLAADLTGQFGRGFGRANLR